MTLAVACKRTMLVSFTVFVAVASGVWIWGIAGAFVTGSAVLLLFALCYGVISTLKSRLAGPDQRHASRFQVVPPNGGNLR